METSTLDQLRIAENSELHGDSYLSSGKYETAIEYYKNSLEIYTVLNHSPGRIKCNLKLGDAHIKLAQFHGAIDYGKNSLEISTDINDQSGIENANCLLGKAYSRVGENKEAINCFEKSLEISTAIGDRSGIASNNGNLGNVYCNLGEYHKAIQCHEKSLKISTTIGDLSGIASNNGNLGNAYLSLGEYQKAIEYYEKGLKLSTAIGDQSGIASNYGNLGNAYLSLAEYQKAIQYYQKGLQISTAIGDQLGIASHNGNLGNVYDDLGEYHKAIQYHEKCLEISTAIGDQSGIASANGNLGNAYLSLGEYQKAIQYYEKGLEISTAIGDRSGIANNNGNLGNVYDDLGEYHKAIQYHEKSLEISIAIGDQSGIASDNGNLGNAYLSLGEYQKAIQYYEQALEISTAIGDRSGIANNNGNLGNVYDNLGEYHKAIQYHEKSLEISTAIGDLSGIASDNGNLGNAYLSLREYQKAIQYYEKGLEISTAIGDPSGIANNNGNLGNVYDDLGEYHKAIQYHEKSLEISTAIGDRSGIASDNGNLGNAYLNLGEHQKAIKYYKKGLEISIAIGDQSGIASDNGNLGNAYLDLGEYKNAWSHLEDAISHYDKIFFKFVPDRHKLSFITRYFKTHRLLMSCFLSLKRDKSALLVFDLGKAKELHFRIERSKNRADAEMKDFSVTAWNRIRASEEEIEIQEIQQILHTEQNDTSILVFAFDNKGFLNIWVLNEDFVFSKVDAQREAMLWLMVELLGIVNVNVDRNSSFQENAYNQVNDPLDISSRKQRPTGEVGKNSKSDSCGRQEILEKLFQLVIDPVKNSLKGNKLIIVPDQFLFFAPFSSLVDANGCFLTSEFSIQITPSLHTLKASMQREPEPNTGFALFVGNPTAEKISFNGEEFNPLPGAAEEVKYLANLFQATPLLGRAARKEVVLQLLSKASIIHIAAHGEPNRGEIILAPNTYHDQPCSPVAKPESFLLTQEDITGISVQARLVVLCCCYTGRGKVSSEGVIGIARSFLAAGARSVLATLWPINDWATIELMKKFYEELFQETPVCEALRRAKNFLLEHENKNFQSIGMWAPFTIYGEDVKFEEQEIEEIKKKSREMFDSFVVLP